MPFDRPHDPAPEAVTAAVRSFQDDPANRDRHFTFLVQCFYPVVQRFFTRRVGPTDALDLTQMTFSRVYEKLGDLREPEKFGGWLLTIARNILHRFLQNRQKERGVVAPLPDSREDGPSDFLERYPDDRDDGLAELLKSETQGQLRSAVATLPPKQQRCVELRIYQDMDYRGIASEVGISVQTVKAHLFQAKERLREILAQPVEGEE
jgi:RNA polymerase sigma-70 factor (ECF subfamily)